MNIAHAPNERSVQLFFNLFHIASYFLSLQTIFRAGIRNYYYYYYYHPFFFLFDDCVLVLLSYNFVYCFYTSYRKGEGIRLRTTGILRNKKRDLSDDFPKLFIVSVDLFMLSIYHFIF